MGFIFSASTAGMSFGHTSRFLGPILRWIDPDMSQETIQTLVAIIRKMAHVFEYAVLCVLVWWALRRPKWRDTRPWSWRQCFSAFAVASVYAMTDEFHQAFVPSRGASVMDVGLDMIGAAAGILFLWVVGRCFNRW
jgi:VanZ family protein